MTRQTKSPVDFKFSTLLKIIYSYMEQNPESELTVFKVPNRPLPYVYFDQVKQVRVCGHEELIHLNRLN